MTYQTKLPSPLGTLTLASNGEAITGLWLEGQKYFAAGLERDAENSPELPVFCQTAMWLERYFAGWYSSETPPLAPQGSGFRQAVWKTLLEIPYGQTCTYRALAEKLGSSPRAVGGAVGHNPISILIPCHRVVGTGGALTGYAGGVEKKRFLLELERTSPEKRKKTMFFPSAVPAAVSDLETKENEAVPTAGKFPCPCCGYKTFPVPKEDAIACICPVCFWENDVFTLDEDAPSDENHGMTLREGRAAYRRLGAVREEFLQHTRKPLPEETP